MCGLCSHISSHKLLVRRWFAHGHLQAYSALGSWPAPQRPAAFPDDFGQGNCLPFPASETAETLHCREVCPKGGWIAKKYLFDHFTKFGRQAQLVFPFHFFPFTAVQGCYLSSRSLSSGVVPIPPNTGGTEIP